MTARDRIAKLRRMAEHPTSNPHEAALARAEIDRMRAKGMQEEPTPLTWSDVGRSRSAEEFAARMREKMISEAECFICGLKLDRGWAESISFERCPRHVRAKSPGQQGYYEWARSLALGTNVLVCTTATKHGAVIVPMMKIVRLTATRYELEDKSMFRRTGRFPGYKVGETGREGGRTFIADAGYP